MELLKWVIFFDIIAMAAVDFLIAVRIHRTRKWFTPVCEYFFHLIVFAEGVISDATVKKAEEAGGAVAFRQVEKIAFVAVPLIILIYALFELKREHSMRTCNIAASSVGEGTSKIDCGLLVTDRNGTPILSNNRMAEISRELFGKNLTSSRRFWDYIEHPENNIPVEKTDFTTEKTFKTPKGRVYSFSRSSISGKGRHYYEIIARDVTLLYEKTMELKRQNSELEDVERRLSDIYKNVANLKQEEELFAYKLKLHDELGNAILRGSKLLEKGGFDDIEVDILIEHWGSLLERLKSNSVSAKTIGVNYLDDIRKTSKTLGVELKIKGQYPATSEMAAMAVREALYNAVRHGKASEVFVNSDRIADEYVICISNNGDVPEGEIVEGGGISGLRKNLENVGGTLTVVNNGGVMFRITLPWEE